jgi:MarR family transcriptional regulator, organic hydroperoxide resistance regulator
MNKNSQILNEFMLINEKLRFKCDKIFHDRIKDLMDGSLTLLQLRACMIIYDAQVIKMSDLAKVLNLKTSGATQLIDKLIELGEVERNQDPNDRRTVLIQLSTKTKTKMIKIKQVQQEVFQEIFSPLTETDLQILNTLLQKLI